MLRQLTVCVCVCVLYETCVCVRVWGVCGVCALCECGCYVYVYRVCAGVRGVCVCIVRVCVHVCVCVGACVCVCGSAYHCCWRSANRHFDASTTHQRARCIAH